MQTEFIKTPTLLWLDVVNPSKKELDELGKRFGLPRAAVKDALDPSHLPKFETFEAGEFVMLRHFDSSALDDPEADTIQELTRKIAVFSRPGILITIHRKAQPFLENLRQKWTHRNSEAGTENPTQEEMRIEIFRESLFSFDTPLRVAEEVFERLEQQIFSSRMARPRIEELYFLKRRSGVYRRILRQNLDTVHRFPSAGLRPSQLQDLREEAERILLHAEELVDDSNHLFSAHMSIASHHTNETMRLLTVLTVFFMPLTFLVGVYGMNFRYMPELESKWGYPLVWLAMLAISTGVFVWFRRRGWLNFTSFHEENSGSDSKSP
jgi:magnesium transporter